MHRKDGPEPSASFERRRWRRVRCDFDIVCSIKEGRHRGRALDISGGGMLVMMEDEGFRPEKLHMTFTVPGSAGDREVKAIGNVVRTAGCGENKGRTGLGVSFVVIQSEARQAIMNYVEGVTHPGS